MNAPSGVVTFLFTDIEGSTRRWEADPEAMRVALERHDEILRKAIIGCTGTVFKHTGDGVCAAFSSPRAAINAAIAAQRALELPVRMGIATGEAEMRDGDYFGAVLNRAARIMAAGHGGQILIDGLTAELLTGVGLKVLGSRRLRDIAKPVQLLQIEAPGIRSDFPPLRTLDPAPGNLRAPSTSFIGREAALTDVVTALGIHRLVTLIGFGGVGKTRLALETAKRVAGHFPDGVWVIELAAIGNPRAVPEAVATVLGVTQQPGFSLAYSVAAALEGRSRLLIFDNCEHVLDAVADLIEAILARSDTVRILATSREGLQIPDEQLWPVPSLDPESSAATLFVERAESVAPAISLARETGTVAEICRRLDGIPLAIELAASRMQSMTVTEIRDRLDDRFRLLIGSRRALERHQTLRQAVQWSYDLLADTEKSFLARCSVFVGSFDLAASSAVAGMRDEYAAMSLLDGLVRKSLVVANRSSARTRFSMLETIRQFAEEQLSNDDVADEVRTTHARYFADRESDVLDLWNSPRQREAHDWFELEHANLRAAFRWAADHGDLDRAAAIAVYATFLGYCTEQIEPVSWAEELIVHARAVQHPRLAQLYVAACICVVTGRIDEFLRYAEAAKSAIASGRFDDVRAEFEFTSASGYLTAGQPDSCIDGCRELIARRSDRHPYAQTCLVLGLTFVGDHAAVTASGELLAIAEEAANPNLASFALLGYGWAQRDANPKAAYGALRRALSIAQDSGNRQQESSTALILSRLAVTHGDTADALDALTLTTRHYFDSGSVWYLHGPLAILTALLDRVGLYESAAKMSGFATTGSAAATFPELSDAITHLREVLGDGAYESCARAGATMTLAQMARYAFEQIDVARNELG